MSTIKTLGVLTSGGDCAGLNAVLRAVTQRAIHTYGWRVLGIEDGTLGLIERPLRYRELGAETLRGNMLREAGTILGTTNKGDPFRFRMPDGSVRDVSADFGEGARALGLDALIGIGGDGSMRILERLCAAAGLPLVGVPKTIDNDVHGTEFAVGFATAVNVVTEALDRLQATAASHHRVMILEVMGRDAGHIALNAGLAGGADVILVPELRYTLQGLTQRLRACLDASRTHALVVVAEGVPTADGKPATVQYAGGQSRYGGIGQYLMDRITAMTGAETRVTILGHVQRGGVPAPRDRVLASAFGVHAVDLVARGHFSRMVAWRDRSVTEVPLERATVGPRRLQPGDPLLQVARGLGVYVGEMPPGSA